MEHKLVQLKRLVADSVALMLKVTGAKPDPIPYLAYLTADSEVQ